MLCTAVPVCRGKKEIMKSRKLKRMASLVLASAAVLSMTACGGQQGGNGGQGGNGNSGSTVEAKEYVYVPEFMEIKEENASFYDMKFVGGCLYYENYWWDEATMESGQDIVRYSLTDGSSSKVPVKLDENVNIGEFAVGSDGSIYAVCRDYSGEPGPEGYTEPESLLCKFGPEGEVLFSQSLEEYMEDIENSYIQSVALDSEDRVYLSVDSKLLLLNADGSFQGIADTGRDWISGMGCGRDGKIYVSSYDENATGNFYVLTAVDFDKKAMGESYTGFRGSNGNGLYAGGDSDFICSDSTSVYTYDLKSQKSEKLFDWLDSDINGSTATCLGQLEDGRMLAVINDWETNDNGLALLTKTKSSEIAPRETLVVGVLYGAYDLQAAAVKFNKSNDKYRITIKTYLDTDNWTENSMSDALTSLNNDITSNNCPDIIDLNGVNIQQYAVKGVFEDLTPYLEKSASLNKEDFVEHVLDAYTYNGTLVSIPSRFQLRTVIGRASELGSREGWTISDLIAYADAHPDATIFDYSEKKYILQMCMAFNENTFIDWSTGECKFDTPEFKSLLEFVNKFPDEYQYEEGGASTPTRIQNGEILLDTAYISDFNEMQLYMEIFGGDMTCIGYPTTDGGSGTGLESMQAYAITTKSGHKDGAWEFIEGLLIPEEESDDDRMMSRYGGFPNNKKQLQAMAEKAVEVKYVTDENGEVIKDENGEPIVEGVGMGVGYEDGWFYDYRMPTQEEVDMVLELIEHSRPVTESNDTILNIIMEEADAYFKGQKSVDEVTNIIQSRINIFVSENS